MKYKLVTYDPLYCRIEEIKSQRKETISQIREWFENKKLTHKISWGMGYKVKFYGDRKTYL